MEVKNKLRYDELAAVKTLAAAIKRDPEVALVLKGKGMPLTLILSYCLQMEVNEGKEKLKRLTFMNDFCKEFIDVLKQERKDHGTTRQSNAGEADGPRLDSTQEGQTRLAGSGSEPQG